MKKITLLFLLMLVYAFSYTQTIPHKASIGLKLIEINVFHPSLRLHKLKGKLSDLYSVLINISYRICIDFIIEEDTIIPIDIGKHEDVY